MQGKRISGHRPTAARPAPSRCLAALALAACVVALGLVTAPATAAAAAHGKPFLHAVSRLDHALRVAIELQPQGLQMSLAASERVCFLGALAEERDEAAAAASDWSTLAQIVQLLDEPGLRGVEEAFGRAAATLAVVEKRFSRAWHGKRDQVRALHRAAATVRRGISSAVAGLQPLRQAFAAWTAHRCEAALAGIASSDIRISGAIAAITRGMERLGILAIRTLAPPKRPLRS